MRTLLRTLGGAVVVAAVGFALARFGSTTGGAAPPTLDRQASVAEFRIRFPSDWRLEPARTVPRFPLGDVVTLASPQTRNAMLVIGTTQTTNPAALPQRFQAVLPSSPTPQLVTLGGSRFYRYLNLTPQGQPQAESIYTLPTTVGTITAVCSSEPPSTPFTSRCERVLATIRLTTGSILSLDANPGYALELNRILSQLNSVRRSVGSGLQAGAVSTRVRAASALATAHAQAAVAARHISAVNMSVANRSLVAALDENATALRALAVAAAKGDTHGYGNAEGALVTANRALDAAFAQLRGLGYQVR